MPPERHDITLTILLVVLFVVGLLAILQPDLATWLDAIGGN